MQTAPDNLQKEIRLLLVEDDPVDQIAFARLVKVKKLDYAYTKAASRAYAF